MNLRSIGVIAAFLIWAVNLQARELKIGYVHSQKILAEFQESMDAQKTLDDELKKWQDQAKKMEAEITQLEDELQNQGTILTSQRKAEKEQVLRAKYAEYQRFQQEIWGETGKLYQRNKELTQPLVDKVNAVINKLGKEGNYDIVFDAAVGNIVYAKDEFDMTQLVLDDLNKK